MANWLNLCCIHDADSLRMLAYGSILLIAAAQLLTFTLALCTFRERNPDAPERSWLKLWWRVAASVTALTVLGCLLVVYRSEIGTQFTSDEALPAWFPKATAVSTVFLSLMIVGIAGAVERRFDYRGADSIRQRRAWAEENGVDLRIGGVICLIVFLIFSVVFASEELIGWHTPPVWQWFGPITVLGLFLAVAHGMAALLGSLGRKYKFPFVGAAILLPLSLSAIGWNEHHYIETFPVSKEFEDSEQKALNVGCRRLQSVERKWPRAL